MKECDQEFSKSYKADITNLLNEKSVETIEFKNNTSRVTKEYSKKLHDDANFGIYGIESLLAGLFILWGPLVIGGGATLYPHVKKAYGIEATNLFKNVIGIGREKRKKQFIELFDDIGSNSDHLVLDTDKIVEFCGGYMHRNNAIMISVKHKPCWYTYLGYGFAATIGLGAIYILW